MPLTEPDVLRDPELLEALVEALFQKNSQQEIREPDDDYRAERTPPSSTTSSGNGRSEQS